MTGPRNTSVRELYARLGIRLLRATGNEAAARCFASPEAHRRDDRHPSLSVSLVSGAWFCHACGARGGAYDAALVRGHTPRSAIELLIEHGLVEPRPTGQAARRRQSQRQARSASVPLPPPPEDRLGVSELQVSTWSAELLRHPDLLVRLARERTIEVETLRAFAIGFDGQRITIPIRDAEGALIGLLRWLPFDRRSAPKMLALLGSCRDLFPPPEQMTGEAIVLCEGEPDALAAHSAGIQAVSVPGAASWRDPWSRRFASQTVTIAFDCDPQGRSAARSVHGSLKAAGVTATVVDLNPSRDDGYDLTEHLRRNGRSATAQLLAPGFSAAV